MIQDGPLRRPRRNQLRIRDAEPIIHPLAANNLHYLEFNQFEEQA
jgi:hypothetical protein